MDKYCAKELRNLWYCGTKKYRKGNGTVILEKWYRGNTMVPRNTILRLCHSLIDSRFCSGPLHLTVCYAQQLFAQAISNMPDVTTVETIITSKQKLHEIQQTSYSFWWYFGESLTAFLQKTYSQLYRVICWIFHEDVHNLQCQDFVCLTTYTSAIRRAHLKPRLVTIKYIFGSVAANPISLLTLLLSFLFGGHSFKEHKAPSFQIRWRWNLTWLFFNKMRINWWRQIFDILM